MDEHGRLQRRWERERRARKEAEKLLELKSLALYQANQSLERLAADLAEKEKHGRSILAAAADGILTVHGDGLINSLNPAAEAIFNCTQEAATGRPFDEFLSDTRIADIRTDRQPVEVEGRRACGEIFPMDLAVSRDPSESNAMSILTVRDISERKQAEDERIHMEIQLRHAQKLEAIGQLAAGIAHEINTPTQFVSDNTRFLQDAFGDLKQLCSVRDQLSEALRDGTLTSALLQRAEDVANEIDFDYLKEEVPLAIEQSLEGLDRIARIVRAMKEFSHPGGGEKSAVDINRALLSTVEISRNEWKYHAELETDLALDLPSVPGYAGELNQVFLNIIVNAAHATEAVRQGQTKGRIRILTRRIGASVEIAISDNGGGIPKAIQNRVFDPFFTTKPQGKGSGQGLAIAYSVVVDKHDGSIELDSSPETGTTFSIRLPLDQTP